VTTLAPLPGRSTDPDDEGDPEAGGEHRVVVIPDDPAATEPSVVVEPGPPTAATVDLTRRPPRPPATDVAGQATWLFGLALALLTEGASEDVIMAEVLAEAAGRSRAIEGAYGRAVALLSEFPGDPVVHRTVDLLAKALLRSRRPARAAEEA
jgi:hypothetical protein